jgi:3-oxoacyl-[acyl-carrier protein] reductase
MDLELDGKTALVTAASKGLGRTVAEQFAKEGMTVAISSRSEENLAEAKEVLLESNEIDDDAILTVPIDLMDPDQIRDGVEQAVDRLGGLDILVTNHGGPPTSSFEELDIEQLDRAYNLITRSTCLVVQSAIPHIKASGGGAITHIVSASAREPPENHAISNMLRPTIYGLSKSIANEYGSDEIRSNAVLPRAIMTDRLQFKIADLAERKGITPEEAEQARADELAIDRLAQPEVFGKAVAYISSPAADFVTGSVLPVDGGWARSAF